MRECRDGYDGEDTGVNLCFGGSGQWFLTSQSGSCSAGNPQCGLVQANQGTSGLDWLLSGSLRRLQPRGRG